MSRSAYISTHGFRDIITFGKYSGKTVKEVFFLDPLYLDWAHNSNAINLSKYVLTQLEFAVAEVLDIHNEFNGLGMSDEFWK